MARTATAGTAERALTDAQERFCEEYLVDLNASRAYRAAYPKATEKSARTGGVRLLANVDIAARIAALKGERSKRVQIDAEWVLRRLRRNVRRAMQAEPVRDSRGQPTGEYRYEGAVANGALKLIGEHIGMYTKKLEVRTPDGVMVVPGPVTPEQWAVGVSAQGAALKAKGVTTG